MQNHMKHLFVCLSILLTTYLTAQEYYGLKTTQKETEHKPLGIRLQLNAGISQGSIFNDLSYTKNYQHYTDFTKQETSSIPLELSLGFYLSGSKKGGKLVQLVIKNAQPQSTSYAYTQIGGCYEMYLGRKDFNLFFGVLLSYGSAKNILKYVDNIYYVATEPYLGMHFPLYKAFNFNFKIGYEWQSFDKVHYNVENVSYNSKLDAFNFNSTLGIAYLF